MLRQRQGEDPLDQSIDEHFRSRVHLSNGMSNLIISMMPTRLLTIVELFGRAGLQALARVGGWTAESVLV
jgi:hypothetical protein